jgi:nucleoside-diphosphate-sugar epimerase
MLQHLNQVATKPQRVIIVGAGGFVGSTTLNNLKAKGIETVGITRQEIDLLKPNAQHALAEFVQPNDALVMISAIAPCKNSEQLIDNLQMMQTVCNVIKDKAALLSQVVYISSDAVYADDVALATEDSKIQPSSFHGMMHAARELMIKTAAGNIPLAILRPSILFGHADPHNGYGPNRFFRLVNQGQTITLFGGGEEQRDNIFVDDVAEVIALTLMHRSKGVLNIATGKSHSFKDVADLVVKTAGKAVAVEPTARQNPITHRHFDITACRQAFPAFAYTDIAVGLQKVQLQLSEKK